jgi:peptide/nickel transport system substrate-binding protein
MKIIVAFFVIFYFSNFSFAQMNEFVMTLNAMPISLDPANITDYESAKITNAIYEGLVRYKSESSEIEPCLAISWTASEDGKVWKFYLRKKVYFHDGSEFKSDSVVFSLKRQIDKSHEYYNKNLKYAKFAFGYIDKVIAADDYTVVIHLKKPFAPFLSNLAMPMAAPIVSPAAVRRFGDRFEWNPVGTGPYRMKESTAEGPQMEYVLERNGDYWGGAPGVERLRFRTIKSTTLRFEEFQRGATHVLDNLRPSDIPQINQMQDAVLVRRPGMNVAYLAMNTRRKPFDDLLVRQAVNFAVNKARLIRFVYQGLAVPAATPVPPTIWGHNDDITDYRFDPERARSLLAEAGYENGFDTNIYVMTTPRPYMPDPLEVARLIQQHLAALRIRAAIISYPWREFLERVDKGEHDMCLLGWVGDNGDPDNFLYVLLDEDDAGEPSTMNRAFFSDPEVHDLLLEAQVVTRTDERARLYEKAQARIHELAPWVPLAHAEQVIAYKSSAVGLVYNINGSYYYHNLKQSEN